MNILLIHQNFPGQFKHLATFLRNKGHQVVGLGHDHLQPTTDGSVRTYHLQRGSTSGIHPWAQEFESKVIRGEGCLLALQRLRNSGFVPEVVFAHPGWGEVMFLRLVFPEARLVCLMEYFYRAEGQDLGFDPEFPKPSLDTLARLSGKNANLLLAMEAMDFGVAPTPWQASRLPDWALPKVRLIHEGIDTKYCRPDPAARIRLPEKRLTLAPGDEVLTFVARNLEPVRGFHTFMRALPEILACRPDLKVFVVGGQEVSYGQKSPSGSWREYYCRELAGRLDPQRVFFPGRIPYPVFIQLMQVSRCHVYLSYPFILSWSMLEAMSAGALVVGSATPPVQDVIEHGHNGLLVDFFDAAGLAHQVCEVLAHPERYATLRQQARQTVIERFDLARVSLPAYARLLDECMDRQR